ncbi:MAG: FkbM family methyltransferase [Chloroflexota bacterium]|nr:FkbM family methyltransferase [Chloroflexota bacterium]
MNRTMETHPKLHAFSLAIHRVLSRSRILSKIWLSLIGMLLRALPGFPLKDNIANNLMAVPWPSSLTFGPRSVSLCPGVTVSLIPHVGEFDFRAALSRSLRYETEVFQVLAQRMRGYDAILEIGANVGVFSLFFCAQRRHKDVPVFCLEPSREAFRRLLANLDIDPAPNVYAIPAAVSGKCGLLPFFEPTGHLTNGSLLEGFASIFSERVQRNLVPSIDGNQLAELLMPFGKLLLKIDVEGAEADVLSSLLPLIVEKTPDIVLEVLEPFTESLNAITDIANLYQFYLVTPDGLTATKRFKAHPLYRDYLLVHKEAQQPTCALGEVVTEI